MPRATGSCCWRDRHAARQLGGSAYWAVVADFVGGTPPAVDLAAEAALQRLLAGAARRGLLRSAHDYRAGGVAVAMAEAAIGGPYSPTGLGARVDLHRGGTT